VDEVNIPENKHSDLSEVEKFVRQEIKRKSGSPPIALDQLKDIVFSETGLARFSSFMDSDHTHFSLLSWINLYLDKLFGPEGDISDLSFPFRGDTFNNLPFDQPYNPRWEGIKLIKIINFTSAEKMKTWTTGAKRRKKGKGNFF
jgi:hypothetical protein